MDKAILFDLDGTLVETAPDLMEAHNYVMGKYGYEEKPFEGVRYLAGRGAAQMLIRSIDSQGRLTNQNNKINEETHKKMTSDFIDYYAENISKGNRTWPGQLDCQRLPPHRNGFTQDFEWSDSQGLCPQEDIDRKWAA